jgi:vacuolar-type H+-ATPase subunit I/STV1
VSSAEEADGLRKLVSQLVARLEEQQRLQQQEVQQKLEEQKQRHDQNVQQLHEQYQRESTAFQTHAGEAERVHTLTKALEKASERIEDLESEYETLETIFQPVQAQNEKRKKVLAKTRQLAVTLSQRRKDLELPTKRMGEVDSAKLHALGVPVEEISSLQQLVTNVSWHPWKVVPVPKQRGVEGGGVEKGGVKGGGEEGVEEGVEVVQVPNWDEPQLAEIVRRYGGGKASGSSSDSSTGEQVAEEVLRCSKELVEWNPSGSYCVTIPYHHGKQRELRPDELLKIVAGMEVEGCRMHLRRTAGAHIYRRQASTHGAGAGSGATSPGPASWLNAARGSASS